MKAIDYHVFEKISWSDVLVWIQDGLLWIWLFSLIFSTDFWLESQEVLFQLSHLIYYPFKYKYFWFEKVSFDTKFGVILAFCS